MDFRSLANHGVRHLTPYQPGKPLEELERELGIYSGVKLASNENPLGPSPKALLAAEHALSAAHIYPDGNCYELKQQLAKFLSVNPNQLTIGNGSENILELIVKAYLNSDHNPILSQYAFLTIPIIIKSYGIEAKIIPTQQWEHDIPKTIAAVDKNTKAIFLVNPNNPTGTYVNEKNFRLLMESIPNNVLVISDEAYAEYITISDYPNTLDYLSHYSNLIITRTFSKAYGLAGLRLGYSMSSPEIADILNRSRLPFNVNHVVAKAGCAALTDQEHVKHSQQLNQQGMEQLINELKSIPLTYIPSIANFITIDVGDAVSVYQKLLGKGVIVRPLHAYGMPKHIRVSIGTGEQNTRFLTTIKQVIKNQEKIIMD